MTVVVCGRTNQDDRIEAITRSLRAAQGFCLDVGCERSFDLDDSIQNLRVYRCLECARWLCKPCIVAHFDETNDAYTPSAAPAPRTAIPTAGATASTDMKGGHIDVAEGAGTDRTGMDSPAYDGSTDTPRPSTANDQR